MCPDVETCTDNELVFGSLGTFLWIKDKKTDLLQWFEKLNGHENIDVLIVLELRIYSAMSEDSLHRHRKRKAWCSLQLTSSFVLDCCKWLSMSHWTPARIKHQIQWASCSHWAKVLRIRLEKPQSDGSEALTWMSDQTFLSLKTLCPDEHNQLFAIKSRSTYLLSLRFSS